VRLSIRHFLHPLNFSRVNDAALGRNRAAGMWSCVRHCERKRPVYARCPSFAGQESAEAPLREGGSNPELCKRLWIASSLSLLAMTMMVDV